MSSDYQHVSLFVINLKGLAKNIKEEEEEGVEEFKGRRMRRRSRR